MKKFFSFFAAMLFAGSMMAVENEDIVFKTDAGFGAITITTAGLTGTGADYEFSQGDITVTGTLGYIYNKKHSVYKNGTMIVSAGTNIIDSIQIEYNSTCYPFVELSEGVNLIPEGQKNAGKTNGIQMKTFINVAGGSSCTFTNASAGKTEIREMNVFYHASAPAPAQDYFLKHNWAGAGDWTWKQLAKDGEEYVIRDIYGGTGCNYNTVGENAGSVWVENPTLVGGPQVGDSAIFAYNPANNAITITNLAAPHAIEHLWIIGNIEGASWLPGISPELTNVSENVFEGVVTLTGMDAAYFAFTSSIDGCTAAVTDWDVINSHRYGSAEGAEVVAGTAAAITGVNRDCSFHVVPGEYTVHVDLNEMTVLLTSVTTGLKSVEVVKAQKVIENGKVVIVREGVRYNAQGIKF